jgi:hypothetical protein
LPTLAGYFEADSRETSLALEAACQALDAHEASATWRSAMMGYSPSQAHDPRASGHSRSLLSEMAHYFYLGVDRAPLEGPAPTPPPSDSAAFVPQRRTGGGGVTQEGACACVCWCVCVCLMWRLPPASPRLAERSRHHWCQSKHEVDGASVHTLVRWAVCAHGVCGAPGRRRCCFQMKFEPAELSQYLTDHEAVWPEMQEALVACGWHNYSLFCAHSLVARAAFVPRYHSAAPHSDR